MVLTELEIENFRVFPYLQTKFSQGINIISGLNGQGKTSILESIYYLALTKSFRTTNDNQVISYNKTHFSIKSNFNSEESDRKSIRIFHSSSEGKHLFINKKEVLKFSEYIGTVPCVILTPDDLKLTLGGPSERRKFLDILISQVSPVYLEDLRIYRRALLQKNALLGIEDKVIIERQISTWNEKLVEHGSSIIYHRLEFIDFLNRSLSEYYNKISTHHDQINVIYQSSIGHKHSPSDRDQIKERFEKKLHLIFNHEIERKKSLIGPHRDDIHFFKDNNTFRDFCSQGENKTLVIALKFLEWEYITKERHIKPILLLDDIFGELDEIRIQGLLNFLEVIGQAYITTTMKDKFKVHHASHKYILKEKRLYDA